jgi:hypothetical protein
MQFDAVVTEPTAHQVQASVFGQRFARFGVRLVRDHEQPAGLVVDRDEQRPGLRLPQPVDGALALLHSPSEIGFDQDAEAVAERAGPGPADPQSVARAALTAVRGDEVLGTHRDPSAVATTSALTPSPS